MVNWVVQVSPQMLLRIEKIGRVYVGLRSCKVNEYVGIVKCNKCQGWGHMGRFCGQVVACARCGEEGHHVTCCNRQEVRCINC